MKEKIGQAIVVEGKYDKIRLSNLYDTIIVTTNGFGIFADKAKQNHIKMLAKTKGIIVFTDSDGAGFVIRNYIKNICTGGKVYNAYIPDVYGKEKRKREPGKEGKLGVEGISDDIIRNSLKNVVTEQNDGNRGDMTMPQLYELGLIGRDNSSYLRRELTKNLDIPEHISSKALLELLNIMYTYDEVKAKITKCENVNEMMK